MGRISGGIALHIIPRGSSQQVAEGDSQSLAFDIPKRQIKRAQRVQLFTSRGVEVAAEHHLPKVIGAKRVFADQHRGALLDGIFGAAFADSRNPLIGFNGDNVKTLVERGN